MGTRKRIKSNTRFRKTRSKKQKGGISSDEKLLFSAARNGDLDKVKNALSNGADVNAKNSNGTTALIRASAYGRKEIVSYLLEQPDIDMNATDTPVGWTALLYGILNNRPDIVEILLKKGVDVNVKDSEGYTALITASDMGRTDIVEMLLENGANMNETNNYDETALMVAREKGRTEIVELLETRLNKQEAMEQVKDRVTKIPSLRLLSYSQLPTKVTSKINENKMFLHPGKLGGKRKTRNFKKSKKKYKT
tara:strand:- start:1499 stop:2251 length:753 start_codon:yes stop_codon:yes gene_type:complete